jgi:hemolysin III
MLRVVDNLPTVRPKPRWRGGLHLGAFPLSIILGFGLVIAADGPEARISSAVYAFTCCLLFGVSALYHRGHWSPRTRALLQRLDHTNIFIIIAGTYTPFAVLALSGLTRELVLATVWGGALAGTLLNLTWPSAPRWLNVPLYVALGWVALPLIPSLVRTAGLFATALIALGGIFYTLGAAVFAGKRPDPNPAVFGYHEVFHAFTLAGYLTQYAAVAIVVLGAH